MVVADAPRGLRLPEDLCGFRILVVLGGLYGNARHNQCKSNEADCHHMMAGTAKDMLAPAINSVIKIIIAFGAGSSFVRSRPHATATAKGPIISCLMRCTVPVPTPSSRATLRMPLPVRN